MAEAPVDLPPPTAGGHVRQDALRPGAGVRPRAIAHGDDRGHASRRTVGLDPGARGAAVEGADERAHRVPGEHPARAGVHRRRHPECLARGHGSGAEAPWADPPRHGEDHRGPADRRAARATPPEDRAPVRLAGRYEVRLLRRLRRAPHLRGRRSGAARPVSAGLGGDSYAAAVGARPCGADPGGPQCDAPRAGRADGALRVLSRRARSGGPAPDAADAGPRPRRHEAPRGVDHPASGLLPSHHQAGRAHRDERGSRDRPGGEDADGAGCAARRRRRTGPDRSRSAIGQQPVAADRSFRRSPP